MRPSLLRVAAVLTCGAVACGGIASSSSSASAAKIDDTLTTPACHGG